MPKFRALLLGVSLATLATAAAATPIAVGTDLPYDVLSNAQLAALPAKLHLTVRRVGYATPGDVPPLTYTASASPCSLASGAGDGGSQVPAAGGGCWLANFNGPIDIREFGKTYPIHLYAAVGSAAALDHGGANDCVNVADPCSAQGALGKVYLFDAKNAAPTIHLAAGTYDTSLFAAGVVPGFGTPNASYSDGAFIQLSGAGSGSTSINPTVGGGGCAQNYGDGLTISYAVFELDHLSIGTACPGRSGVFEQLSSQLAPGPDVQWLSASGSMAHVEASSSLEFAASVPFTIASGATATAAIAYGTNSTVNFDGGAIVFNGNATFSTAFISGNEGGVLQFLAGTSVNLNAHTVTGPAYALGGLSILYNQAGITIPASTAGVLTSGGFYIDNVVARLGAVGTAAGTGSAPTDATTNLVLYRASSTNYAGFMTTIGGDICAVAGITSPLCRFNVMHDGGLTAPWSVTGGDEGPGTLNITGPYYAGGVVGVNCASGAVSAATLVVTGGIVTHC